MPFLSSTITETSSSMAVGTLRLASSITKVRAVRITMAVHHSMAEWKGLPLTPRVRVALKASED